MKSKIVSAAFALALLVSLIACKGKKENSGEAANSSTEQAPSASAEESKPTNEPKTYTVTFSPDTAYLGKSKEAFVRLKNAKAVELSDADGKSTGIEFSYELEVTNKQALGTSSVFVNPADFRLQLDNGTNITHDNYNSVSVQPESTGSSVDNKFRIPVGAKPKALNLFLDETRVTVGVELK
jgi:hypothetical protein